MPIGVYTRITGQELLLIGQVWHPSEEKTIRSGKEYSEIRGNVDDYLNLAHRLSEEIKAQGGLEILLAVSHNQ